MRLPRQTRTVRWRIAPLVLLLGALPLPAAALGRSPGEAPPAARPAGAPDPQQPQTQPQIQPRPQPQPERLAAPAGSKHHLFLYLIDALGAKEMPFLGYQRMTVPSLTNLMTEGMTFTLAYSPSPWTVPSVTSILTSLYPSAHGVQKAGDRLPSSAKTLAELMKEKGYETALFSSHPLVGARSGLDQGFDWIEEIPGPFSPGAPREPGETSATLNRRILAWLDKRTSGAPTFIVALSMDPLEPFGAPLPEGRRFVDEEQYRWFAGARRKLLDLRPGNLGFATLADLKRLKIDADRFARIARDVYDGAILYNDFQLGSLKEALKTRGYWDKALFAVTSTHGEELGERGFFGSGATLYNEAVRIPLVISYPAVVPSPRQMRRSCDTVDLLPTLLSLMGFAVPEGVQGVERNVEPTLETMHLYVRPAFAETSPAGALPTGRACMISEGTIKLILNEELPAGIDRPEVELYRGTESPDGEGKNAVAFAPRVAAMEREALDGWRQAKGKPQLRPDADAPRPDPRLKEILRSLGYLAGTAPPAAAKP